MDAGCWLPLMSLRLCLLTLAIAGGQVNPWTRETIRSACETMGTWSKKWSLKQEKMLKLGFWTFIWILAGQFIHIYNFFCTFTFIYIISLWPWGCRCGYIFIQELCNAYLAVSFCESCKPSDCVNYLPSKKVIHQNQYTRLCIVLLKMT